MTGLSREYGDGLYQLAREEDIRPQLHDELMEIWELMKAQPAFLKLLSSRAIEREERLSVVDQTFSGRIHPYLLNFMKLMVEKERFDAFEESVKWFHRCYNEDYGVVEAEVTSAKPLNQAEFDALKAKLQSISGKQVAMLCHVDPALIGGMRVEMDGKRYDNTIQNKLSRLKQSLAKGL